MKKIFWGIPNIIFFFSKIPEFEKMRKANLSELARQKNEIIGTDDLRFHVIEAAEEEIEEFLTEAEKLVKNKDVQGEYFNQTNNEPTAGSVNYSWFHKVDNKVAALLRKSSKVNYAIQGLRALQAFPVSSTDLRVYAGLEARGPYYVFVRPEEQDDEEAQEEISDFDPLVSQIARKKTVWEEFLESESEEVRDTILEDHLRVVLILEEKKLIRFWFQCQS